MVESGLGRPRDAKQVWDGNIVLNSWKLKEFWSSKNQIMFKESLSPFGNQGNLNTSIVFHH